MQLAKTSYTVILGFIICYFNLFGNKRDGNKLDLSAFCVIVGFIIKEIKEIIIVLL